MLRHNITLDQLQRQSQKPNILTWITLANLAVSFRQPDLNPEHTVTKVLQSPVA